jgi:hypothetical protein
MKGSPGWNQRNKQKTLTKIKNGGQDVEIDYKMIEIEENKAENRLRDYPHAYQDFKRNKLFPNKYRPNKVQEDEKNNRQVVKAYKLLQDEVKDRNPQLLNRLSK